LINLSNKDSLIVWRLVDGKPGHEKQSQGLINSIKRKVLCDSFDIPVSSSVTTLINYLGSQWPAGNKYPNPDFIIGAGHQTHLHLLAAKKAHGGKTIVLMKPSLPAPLFDLCVIPEHDQYKGMGRYIETRGVLNTVYSEGNHQKDQGVIMVGGHSKHFKWDSVDVVSQINKIVRLQPEVNFTLTTSRRTPSEMLTMLQEINIPTLEIFPFEMTTPGWLEQKLANSAYAWITEDSVSMVYEALTAQAAVGLINLSSQKENRITRGVHQLINNNMVVKFDERGEYLAHMKPLLGFKEADRCADIVLRDWMTNNSSNNALIYGNT
jgi:mitochondrial fission protein ELM1